MKTHLLLFASVALFTFVSQAKTLLVSDIDDTIKISHVMQTRGVIWDAFQTQNAFFGMSRLYSTVKAELGQNLDIVYLTNAPSWLMSGRHQTFLNNNQFPAGELSLMGRRENKNNHKLKVLRQKLSSGAYDTVLLFGDNGEKDASIYNQIENEFPRIKFVTFIHQVYSIHAMDEDSLGTALFQNQIGFVTPVEVMLELSNRQIIQESKVTNTLTSLVNQIQLLTLEESHGQVMFPEWQDCRDFNWHWTSSRDDIKQFQKFVLTRCSQIP